MTRQQALELVFAIHTKNNDMFSIVGVLRSCRVRAVCHGAISNLQGRIGDTDLAGKTYQELAAIAEAGCVRYYSQENR